MRIWSFTEWIVECILIWHFFIFVSIVAYPYSVWLGTIFLSTSFILGTITYYFKLQENQKLMKAWDDLTK